MKWIVGLGNPGKRYQDTRHNVGFLVVDRFAREHGFEDFRKKFSALVAARQLPPGGALSPGGDKVVLLKPQTYMNLSGEAVREAIGYYGGGPADLLVVHDDLDLPLGRLRYRAQGSSGGHRGVQSIIERLGTSEFARLKVGIGREEGREVVDFVLGRMGAEERKAIDRAVERAVQSLDVWMAEGVERAASRYNAPEGEPGRDS